MSSRGSGYFGNLINQVASGVSSHISQLDNNIQSVAQNIGEAIRGSQPTTSTSSTASSQATTPDDQPRAAAGASRRRSGGDIGHPFSLFMGNGGVCGRGNSRQDRSSPTTPGPTAQMMVCDNCSSKFSVFSRKKECPQCRQYFCDKCYLSGTSADGAGGKKVCERCKVLLRDPPIRADLMELRVIDLKRYLMSKRISIKDCVEKKDLVELVVRENGGAVENHAGALGRSEPRPSGSTRPIEKPQQNFPKSYVQSTHRQEWFENLERTEDDPQPRPTPSPPEETPVVELEEDMGPTAEATPVEPMEVDQVETPPLSTSLPSEPVPPPPASDRLLPEQPELRPSSMPSSPKRFSKKGLVHLSDLETLEDLQELSVKQCKEILAMNRVNFKGVVEKDELLKILKRLWSQEQRLKEGKDEMEDDELCKICMDSPVDCVMLECGHMCTCTSCGKLMNECPICRQYVVRVVKIFKA